MLLALFTFGIRLSYSFSEYATAEPIQLSPNEFPSAPNGIDDEEVK